MIHCSRLDTVFLSWENHSYPISPHRASRRDVKENVFRSPALSVELLADPRAFRGIVDVAIYSNFSVFEKRCPFAFKFISWIIYPHCTEVLAIVRHQNESLILFQTPAPVVCQYFR